MKPRTPLTLLFTLIAALFAVSAPEFLVQK